MNNFRGAIFIVVAILTAPAISAQQRYSLADIISRAKTHSTAAKQVETQKENRYWQYRYYKTEYNPQLRLTGNLPTYYKRVDPILQPDGTIVYLGREQTDNFLQLGLVQPIRFTGGEVSINTNLNYFKDFRNNSFLEEQWSGTVMNIRFTQPLLSFNRLRWQRKTQPLLYEESKRQFVEQTETISRQAVERFFNVIANQIALRTALYNLANNDTIYKIEQGRYNIGTTSKDKILQVELQLLRSRQDVAQARLNLETATLQLRSYIGLTDTDPVELVLPDVIPEFDVNVDEALQFARQNRSDYIAFERRRIEADLAVAQAEGERFRGTTLTAAYGLNNNGLAVGDIYNNPQEQQMVNLTLSVPVLDWGRNRSYTRTAEANKKLNDYIIAQDEVTFEQDIYTKVRQFEMLRLQIEITKKADEVAQERYNVAQNRYLIGKIDITNLSIALTEKDQAKRSYIEALQMFWEAYYELRRITLYDFATRQPLYTGQEP
jgi:outer membrane protein TolC